VYAHQFLRKGKIMATIDEHSQDCMKELGEPFKEVHEWLDEFFPLVGEHHRVKRHHVEGIKEAEKLFGPKGALAAEIHIKKDCYGKVPTVQEAIMWDILTGPSLV